MKKIVLFYRNSKLKVKLFIIFGLSSILPIFLLWGISTKVNENALTKKVNQMMTDNLTQIAERVNMNLEIYTNVLYQMNQDDQLTESIKMLLDGGEDKAVTYKQISRRLKQYNNVDGNIRCISVVCANGDAIIYDTKTDSAIDNLWRNYSDLRMIPPFMDAEGKSGMVVTPTVKFQEEDGYSHYLHISRRIFDLNNLDRGSIATIIVSVDEKSINEICNPEKTAEDQGFNFIIAKDGTVISYPDENFAGKKVQGKEAAAAFVKESALLDNKMTELNQIEDDQTGWIFYNVYDKTDILQDVRQVQMIFLLVGSFALCIATVSIFYFVRQINYSVNQVVEGMQKVQEGNLDVEVEVQDQDEVGMIANHFNRMTRQIKGLIEEVKRATEQQKNAEIHALEAQINPHFLYNTLDSINWMAIENEEYEISKMLRNLGIILRYSIGKSNSKVKVYEMADWMEKYIGLQKMRFDNVFSYTISVDKETEQCLLYKLLLQPFIENAILHGFKELEGGGRLRVDISLSEEKSSLLITIEDNGSGMPKELAQSYNNVQWAIKNDGENIGLHNAFSRMHMYYGERASWKVTGIENRGTIIMLKLPAEWSETDADIDCRG